uniref:Putative tick transposon n=1 Tax=Rhipicephalus pulchellus TaxID=72859 RepID=L7LYN3_RHIPC
MHINSITAKASRSLGYLCRNLRYSPSNLRQLAYETIVRPQLEYASSLWSPHQIYLTNKLEFVQNRAARFITSNYSPHSSIMQIKQDISLVPLNLHRSIALLSLFHKYRYGIRPSPLPLEAPSRVSRHLRNQYSIKRISGRTNAFNSSALPRAIVLWNDLPDHIALISNHQAFLDELHKHFLN